MYPVLHKGWPAPAKLNLMLRIVGRRPDGYHLLQTVFQFVDITDKLYFQVRQDSVIRRLSPVAGVPEEQDLVIRAAHLLRQETGAIQGVDIRLEKLLPMGGGLGGGSSDAATTLVALNSLWDLGLETDCLAELGLQLGADVPVFVRGYAAWGEGVGESLNPIDLPEPWYLILLPDCHVSTAEIFTNPELKRDSTCITPDEFLSGNEQNDCLPIVRRYYPEVAEALDWLDQFAVARLTGTGGCVFAAFDDEVSARQVHQQLPEHIEGVVAQGMNRSPLLDMSS
ncbi:4-diphosphocytidyl-2-C-methyl-D-erythritol kinase [hydrothermal vent metagenome]|uniref:4-(cytidine 5'-diphospho)-2-C-methyl-D-erythritol kinase n=1 Tax=hydrothermal vent metagenome TaxID=652676 RepID=A0A3B1B961_9ZZZZ